VLDGDDVAERTRDLRSLGGEQRRSARVVLVDRDELVGTPFGPNYPLFGWRHDFSVPRVHRTVNHG